MSRAIYDTLILSDLHLGSQLSRASAARQVLRQNRFRRLILLGDIFSDLNFGRLTQEHWKLLSYIRKLSNPKRGIEIVWVEGNHDRGLSHVMSHLVGIRVFQEYLWDFAGRRHLAIHGHQFDRFVCNNLLLSRMNSFLHLQLQKLDFKGQRFSRVVDRLGTRWLRLSAQVCSGAIFEARMRGADRVFCGHTHKALGCDRDGVEYYNTGCWTDTQPTYVTIGWEGVRIHEYHERSEYRNSSEKRGEVDSSAAAFADETGLLEDLEHAGVGG
jgi:UDP-2,3-diacylglucosamine pyrophosphatase LpxH